MGLVGRFPADRALEKIGNPDRQLKTDEHEFGRDGGCEGGSEPDAVESEGEQD